MKKLFSKHWNSSTQVRKQRKYRFNAPLHLKRKFLHVHLAPALRTKYGLRNIGVRKGDKVKVLRGQFKKKEGKVERVDTKREKVYVTGIEVIKKDGSKVMLKITPSNLMIMELELGDKKRKEKLEKTKKVEKTKEKKAELQKDKKSEFNKVKSKEK